ncbi:uncharacterized protein GGS22DRAFT_167263 [Annulohypoxylon maeteangense]|uniref:uncharacterized protein n=1 Tax=Annulohypoxylon maeteangense TaxID=1927788 RepID=UPI002007FE64|nr:uncharacterized protein GGS22DRAFT_167263 [Annulohypoxylon maeteangense]KAI0883531.1 hypothetical protein GGS22DRAFT_167263 [Annulohypoxylon maeteangense]
MPHHKRAQLLEAATAFCTSFAEKKPLDEILDHFSASPDILAYEHRLSQLAPFLGREFRGRAGVQMYFEKVSSCLDYEDMRFADYVVDAMESRVAVRGTARFTWVATGESWDEVFAYALVFDEGCRVLRYEIWADSGAAYLASQGRLREVRGE